MHSLGAANDNAERAALLTRSHGDETIAIAIDADARASNAPRRARGGAAAIALALALGLACACGGAIREHTRTPVLGATVDAQAVVGAVTPATPTTTSKTPTANALGDDDLAMRDDALESAPNAASSDAMKTGEEFMRMMRKALKARSGSGEKGSENEVSWMVSQADRANVAMDDRGWFVGRSMREREMDDWLWSNAASVGEREVDDRIVEDDGDLRSSPAKREAEMFNSCPNLVYVGPDHASDEWPTIVRQLGYAHGLRGATSGSLETFNLVRTNHAGPNFVLAGDVPSYASLLHSFGSLTGRDGKKLVDSPSVFLIAGVQDPLIRAIESYLQFGVAQRGWTPTLENFKNFMFGKYGREAHVHNIQFKTLAPQYIVDKVLKNEKILAAENKDGVDAVSNEEIMKVLNLYDVVSTPDYEDESRMILKQMLFRIVGVRQLISPPKVGYANLDRYGFAKLTAKDGAQLLPRDVKDYLSSEEFTSEFTKFNALDYRLYLGANARMLRLWDEHRKIGSFLEWRETIKAWVLPRVEITDSFKVAAELGVSQARKAVPCAIGEEANCATQFAKASSQYVEQAMKEHASEECLFENQGCLSRQMINLGLEQYKESRREALSMFMSSGETDKTYGTRIAAKCAEKAFEPNFETCADDATFGTGTLGKSMVAEADIIYLICAGASCDSLCVPKMWAKKARVVNGLKVDQCLGVTEALTHFRRATLTHGAVIAHADHDHIEHAAVVEVDAAFVDPDVQRFPHYDSELALKKVKDLFVRTSAEGEAKFTILRLGYRAWEFEKGSETCPHGCGCRYSPLDVDASYCMVTRTQCDLRGSHAYILSRDAYALFLEPVLSKTSANRIIDFNVFQRFPQQAIVTPMLAVQSSSSAGADYVSPQQQLRDSDAFRRTCNVH